MVEVPVCVRAVALHWKWGENEGSTGRPVAMLTQYLMDRAAEA